MTDEDRRRQRQYQKEWRAANPDKQREYDHACDERRTPQERRERLRKKRQRAKTEERKARVRTVKKNRYQDDPAFRLQCVLRSRLTRSLNGLAAGGSAVRDLGCTTDELKKHLESQFWINMDWSNYGKGGWVIDHTIPLCAFDLTDPAQVKLACHYTNLRPMWEEDNLTKIKHDLQVRGVFA